MRTCHNIERSKLEPKFELNSCASGSALKEQWIVGRGGYPGIGYWTLGHHGQPARKNWEKTDYLMGSFLQVCYTSFSLLLTLDLCRLCGPVPATLGCPLEHAVEGSKSVPGQEDISQL
jgi:hypothetical protein